MDWKEFLKPTKLKIITFIITLISIIIYFMFFPSMKCLDGNGPSFCYGNPSVVSVFLFWPANLVVLFLHNLGTASGFIDVFFRAFILVLGIVGNLFYIYLISILVVKIIKKFKTGSGA